MGLTTNSNQLELAIVVPAFNGLPYLADLRASLEGQSSPAFRVLLVDDGSTDGTAAAFDAWAREDARCTVLHQENGGLSAARNAALAALAAGACPQAGWIVFLDADDKLAPQAVEHLLKAAQDGFDDLFFSSSVFFESADVQQRFAHYETLYARHAAYPPCTTGPEFLRIAEEAGEFTPSACMQLLRRDFILEQGIRFKEGIIHEDNLFTFTCLMHARKVAFLNEELYERRVREGSTMTAAPSWKNVNGFFHCGLGMLQLMEATAELSPAQMTAAGKVVARMFCDAMNYYFRLPPDDQARIPYTGAEGLLFSSLVAQRLHEAEMVDAAAARTRATVSAEYESSASWKAGRALSAPLRVLQRK